MKSISGFINDQLSVWPMACANFRALRHVAVREFSVGGLGVRAQFNPSRLGSSAAKTDSASLRERPCFLCPENRYPEQISLRFDGRKGKTYDILVNPFPVFADHVVVAFGTHTEQSIWKRFVDLLDLARTYPDFIFFYNGPKCGASAPDHHHFQGTKRGAMPLENDVDALLDGMSGGASDEASGLASGTVSGPALEWLVSAEDAELYHYGKFTTGIFVIRGVSVKSVSRLFYRLLDCAPRVEGDREPRFNLFVYCKSGEYRCIVVFRRQHRSHHYFSTGADHLTMSPGCVDMAGLFIVPVAEDFEKLDSGLLESMLAEVSLSPEEDALVRWRLTRTQRTVSVGIMSAPEIEFEVRSEGAGVRRAVWREGKIEYDGALFDELYFEAKVPSTLFAEPSFVLHGVTIGKGFHWERTENQRFAGALKIIVEGDALTAVNVVGVEDYLLSVISSEMSAAASLEFLKAHAVISRSWIMARLEACEGAGVPACGAGEDVSRRVEVIDGETHITCWYGRSQHMNFDVCADDHCQRYQGVQRAVGPNVRAAVDATWGEVLTFGGEICDARFSKCCGGRMELFSTCWEDRDLPYLQALADTPGHREVGSCDSGEVSVEFSAETSEVAFGEASGVTSGLTCGEASVPVRAFCDTRKRSVLSQVLNDYDRETTDFYRWTVVYDRDEISALISERTGVDIGRLSVLEPVETGPSGRIRTLRIRGDKATVVVGKELEIRKVLSPSHLKSSAFTAVYLDSDGNEVGVGDTAFWAGVGSGTCCSGVGDRASGSGGWSRLLLRGRGWGHGVGLCQIGAAVMASEGSGYRAILSHYYPGTGLEKR